MAPLTPRVIVKVDVVEETMEAGTSPPQQMAPSHTRRRGRCDGRRGFPGRDGRLGWRLGDKDSAEEFGTGLNNEVRDHKGRDEGILDTNGSDTPPCQNPIFEIGPVSEWLVFEGTSVHESGRQYYLDPSVAYERIVLNAIDYFSKFGYSKKQLYLLLSCRPCEGRIWGIVDSPNAVATLAVPISIFDQDVRPKSTGRVPEGPRVEKRKPDVLTCTYDGDLPITKNPGGAL